MALISALPLFLTGMIVISVSANQDTPPPTDPSPNGAASGQAEKEPEGQAARERVRNRLRERMRNGDVPTPEGVEFVPDVVYATVDGKDGKPLELRMDVAFKKEAGDAKLPVIVYIHGGGWQGGDKSAGRMWNMALAEGGYCAVSVGYRLSGEATYPAGVHDCKAAIRFLKTHAEQLGIDPARIGVWGHSAGGHLSALLATSSNTDVLDGSVGGSELADADEVVACAASFAGPTDMWAITREGKLSPDVVAAWMGGPCEEKKAELIEASPVTYVDANDPPIFIVHGTNDLVVSLRQAEILRDAILKAGGKHEYLVIEGADHGIADPQAYEKTAEFFDTHLGGHAIEAMKTIRERAQQGRGGDGSRRRPNDPASPQSATPPPSNTPAQPVTPPLPPPPVATQPE